MKFIRCSQILYSSSLFPLPISPGKKHAHHACKGKRQAPLSFTLETLYFSGRMTFCFTVTQWSRVVKNLADNEKKIFSQIR